METVAAQRPAGARAAQDQARQRPDDPLPRAGGDRRGARPGRRRRCASSATTSRTSRATTSSRRWSSSRTAWPARASTAASRSRACEGQDDVVHARGDQPPLPALPRTRADRGPARSSGAPPATPTTARSGGGRAGDRPGRPAGRKRFAYPPQLVVVDGGAPQVAAAQRALDELGIDDVAVCGLAKRLEEVWLPGDDDPVVLPRTSEGLYLLQRVRDEAHRFAITYQRSHAGQAHDREPPGRRAGPRRDPQAGAAQALRLA